jgi:OOP family OmpA-OmpF porin
MFERLVNETATRFNLTTASVSALEQGVLSLMTNERTGGVEGFFDLFRRAGLVDVIISWFGGKEGRSITASQLESALGTGTLDTLSRSSGLTLGAVTTALTFLLPKLIGRLTPNGLLPSTTALRSQISSQIDRPFVSPVEHRPDETRRKIWPAWLPWAAATALAVAGVLWLRTAAGTIDPQLTISTRDSKVTYSGLVRDEATRTAIVNGLRTTFGEANIDGNLRIDGNVKPVTWLPRLPDLLASLKTPGVEFSLNGNTIDLGGWFSAADRQALGDKLRGIFGAQASIGSLRDAAGDAVRVANEKALSALGAIGTSGRVSPDALVQAMNLAIINFSSGSAEIAPDSSEIIRKSAEAIKRAPAGSGIEIGGHTDNTGDAASNLALSQARADAVKAALEAAGVTPSMLATKGYGDTRPRATNDTEYGRFQNRRIEYTVVSGR